MPSDQPLPAAARSRGPAPVGGAGAEGGEGGEGRSAPALADAPPEGGFLGWIDRLLSSQAPAPRGGGTSDPSGPMESR